MDSTAADQRNEDEPRSFGFLLLPNFAMMAFTAAIEPLRAANLLSGKRLYSWRIISPNGQAVQCSNGTQVVAHCDPGTAGRLENVVICGGVDSHIFEDQKTFAWLRRIAREGVAVGAISDGAFVLARTGLLEGYRCTIHWQCIEAFKETFPEIDIRHELFQFDRTRFTCAGGTSALDMMLRVIEFDHDHALAAKVADQFLHERIREYDDSPRMALRQRVGVGHPKLLRAIALMEENLELPLSSTEIAEDIGISTRQLERLFSKYLKLTPRAYYIDLRLSRARWLLCHSALSVTEVGIACGFISSSHFAKCYRKRFAETPTRTRMGPGAGS
jgi:transcriptional regulator GlxA family with amidase domain